VRTNILTASIRTETRNGILHPQACICPSVKTKTPSHNETIPVANRMPTEAAVWGREPKKPRRAFGADSMVRSAAHASLSEFGHMGP
jgi:hypothetical protein